MCIQPQDIVLLSVYSHGGTTRSRNGDTTETHTAPAVGGGMDGIPLFSAVQTGAEQLCSEGPGTCPADTRFCYGGGGDQSSSAAQITVTPYPARIEGIENQVYCQSKQAVEFSGPNAASVWQAQGADDFWVFHGCDGAGVMQDCFGGNSLVEHYLGKADAVTEPNRCDFQPTDCFNPNKAGRLCRFRQWLCIEVCGTRISILIFVEECYGYVPGT